MSNNNNSRNDANPHPELEEDYEYYPEPLEKRGTNAV